MKPIDNDRLPHILQTFPNPDGTLPDPAAYEAQIQHYLPILLARHPQTATSVLYEALLLYFGNAWKVLYEAKRRQGELERLNVIWWGPGGTHQTVSAAFYVENWKENYAARASNWNEVISIPENLSKIAERIAKGIAGLLFVKHYESMVLLTLRHRQGEFQRQVGQAGIVSPPVEYRDKYGALVNEIGDRAVGLRYPDGLNFLAEVSGAYILSCPVNQVRQDSRFKKIAGQNPLYSIEEVCAAILVKYIYEYGSQEFAHDASDFPLHYMKKPGRDWKYVVVVPDPA